MPGGVEFGSEDDVEEEEEKEQKGEDDVFWSWSWGTSEGEGQMFSKNWSYLDDQTFRNIKTD